MANNNALILAVNRFDDGTCTEGPEDTLWLDFVNDSYGLVGANPLPVSNLKDPDISLPWRTQDTNPLKTWVRCDFGLARAIDTIAVISHNWTSAATWRVRLSDDPTFNTSTYDSGYVSAWPSVSGGFGSLPWGVFNWGDVIATADAPLYNINSICILPSIVVARYLRIDISDSANPAGYLQTGRCMAGAAYRPSINIQYGWPITFVDEASVSKSVGKKTYVDKVPKYRQMKLQLDNIPEAEMLANIFDFIDRRKGIGGDLLVIPQPSKPDLFIHEALYCRLSEISPVINNRLGMRTRELVFEELI